MISKETVYGIKHRDENIRAASRSGGIFTAVSDLFLENGGAVYGCRLDENFTAEHARAVTKEQRDEFRGSKYIQSRISDTYQLVLNDLKSGLCVLFSGTPCQVHGLLNFLKIKNADTGNLLTVDILCHGVPSPKVWTDYLGSKFDRDKITAVDFRDKNKFGWRARKETVTVSGTEHSSEDFARLFYSDIILRPSCFYCNYKTTDRISDITIGDFWRIEHNDKEYDDDKGVSLVMINTEKGSVWFKKCRKDLEVREYRLEKCIQPVLETNYAEPAERESFWEEYSSDNILKLMDRYVPKNKPTLRNRINIVVFSALKFCRGVLTKVTKRA